MTNELKSKIDEIANLSEINNKITGKLKEFQEQNEANVRLFQEESLNQAIKARQLQENNRILSEEMAKNTEKINELLLKNHSLNKNIKENEDQTIKVKTFIRKIIESSKEKEEKLESFFLRKQANRLKISFFEWKRVFLRGNVSIF